MSGLPELVAAERKRRRMTVRAVAAAAGTDGQGRALLSSTTVSDIERGRRTQVTPRALEGLSVALGVPITRLREASGNTGRVPSAPFVLPDRANLLTAKERRLVLAMVDGLLEARRQ